MKLIGNHLRPSENSGMAMPLGARCPGGRSRQDFWIGSLVGGQSLTLGIVSAIFS